MCVIFAETLLKSSSCINYLLIMLLFNGKYNLTNRHGFSDGPVEVSELETNLMNAQS